VRDVVEHNLNDFRRCALDPRAALSIHTDMIFAGGCGTRGAHGIRSPDCGQFITIFPPRPEVLPFARRFVSGTIAVELSLVHLAGAFRLEDGVGHHCGLFGAYNVPNAAAKTYLGLFALQHRGQESAGIVASDGKKVRSEKGMGLVTEVFSKNDLDDL